MLTRKLWNELKDKWPSPKLNYDWDLWMRDGKIRDARECVIPDVSRTYHLGIKGVNMNRAFHERYFENRALNQIDFVNLTDVDRLIELNYELHILDLIKKGHVINEKLDIDNESNSTENDDNLINSLDVKFKNLNRKKIIKWNKRRRSEDKKEKSFCNQLLNYFQQLNSVTRSNNTTDHQKSVDSTEPVHILYINMKHEQDFDSWLKCASCLQLWDLIGDPRGMHKGVLRITFFKKNNCLLIFFYKMHKILLVG